MRRLSLIIMALFAVVLASCQGPPPTQIVLVVTATPGNAIEEATAEVEAVTEEPSASPTTPAPTLSATPTQDSGPTVIPTATPIVNQIQVAEQVFENGRMFWIQPTNQIWVMIVTEEGRGDWSVYTDDFEEGEPETDPDLTAPTGMEQPRRGFGKLWRENPEIMDALGWAITPEFGYVTRYEYHCIQEENAACVDGYHIVTSLYEEAFRFNEDTDTWQLN